MVISKNSRQTLKRHKMSVFIIIRNAKCNRYVCSSSINDKSFIT